MSDKRIRSGALNDALKVRDRERRSSVSKRAKSEAVNLTSRNDPLPSLVVENLPLSSLRVPARRIRKADAAHTREVANSVAAFGFNVPLLIGTDGSVVDGMTRYDAARQLGL